MKCTHHFYYYNKYIAGTAMRTGAKSVLLCLLLALVEVHSQTAPYLTFMGNNVPNSSYVVYTRLFGRKNELRCNTDLTTCCTSAQGDDRGNWYFPNGKQLSHLFRALSQGRSAQRTVLHYRGLGFVEPGIYRCDIETVAVNNDAGYESIYVGLYDIFRGGGEESVY